MNTDLPTVLFEEFLDSLHDVSPANTEHKQSRARQIHDYALQIVADGPFAARVRTSFPILKNAGSITDTEFAAWWGRFREWYDRLPYPQQRLLNLTRVCRPA